MNRVVVNGVVLTPPEVLSADEVHLLGVYNAWKAQGGTATRSWNLETIAMVQLRFDWLGYLDERGVPHPGNRALPQYIRSHPPVVPSELFRGWVIAVAISLLAASIVLIGFWVF